MLLRRPFYPCVVSAGMTPAVPPCPPMTINLLARFWRDIKKWDSRSCPRDCPTFKLLALLFFLQLANSSADHFPTGFTRRQTKLLCYGRIADFFGQIVVFGHLNYRGL